MDAKHTFKYSAEGFEDIAPVEITYEIPTGEATITEMLRNFEYYLKAVGYHFDGHLDIVDETLDNIDTADEIYGCMADFDKDVLDESEDCCGDECGCESASSPLENDEYYKSKKLKEWNEGIAKLDNEQRQKCREEALKMSKLHDEAIKEVKKNKWFHGLCNPPSPDWKKSS